MMLRVFAVLLVLTALTSCKEPDARVAIAVVYKSQFCLAKSQGFEQLASQQSVAKAIGSGHLLGKKTELPALDFNQSHYLLISMGSRPSGGYELELSESEAAVYENKLLLPVEFKQPAEGMMQAAVMSSPCLIVSLAKGEYRQVVLQAEGGLMGLDLKP